jgi:deoxyribodipyrimidine photolyase
MEPAYTLITLEADYREACDTVIARAEHEIMIFDRDLAAPRLDDKARIDRLASFLSAEGLHRMRIVLHAPETLRANSPRLMQLFTRFSHLIEIRQSPDNLRHLADTHILADDNHAIRRFQFDQPRCALHLDDPLAVRPWRQRFDELWEQSTPCLSVNATGL